jgi:hypothetical protein
LSDWGLEEKLCESDPEIKSIDEPEEELGLAITITECGAAQVETDKTQTGRALIQNPDKEEQKINQPSFVIKKKNIQKVKKMIGNKLAMATSRSQHVIKPLEQESKS